MSDRGDSSFRSLDELLDDPFEKMESELRPGVRERIEAMEAKLQKLDDELTEYLERSSCAIQ